MNAEWIIEDSILKVRRGSGHQRDLNASEIFSLAFRRSAALQVDEQLPDHVGLHDLGLKFSRFPLDLYLVVEGTLDDGDFESQHRGESDRTGS